MWTGGAVIQGTATFYVPFQTSTISLKKRGGPQLEQSAKLLHFVVLVQEGGWISKWFFGQGQQPLAYQGFICHPPPVIGSLTSVRCSGNWTGGLMGQHLQVAQRTVRGQFPWHPNQKSIVLSLA